MFSLAAGRGLLAIVLRTRPLAYLGNLSFGIYVYNILGFYPGTFNIQGYLDDKLTPMGFFYILLVVVIIVADLSIRFIEEPCRRKICEWYVVKEPTQDRAKPADVEAQRTSTAQVSESSLLLAKEPAAATVN